MVSIQAVDPNYLRVCADPNNLPFSNDAEEGFENKIAELLSEKLGRPLVYNWHPQVSGYVRNTLSKKKCDLIIGITARNGDVLNTNPYYRSAYVMVYRKDSGITARNLADPQMKNLKIGAVAGTPPDSLLEKYGLLLQIHPYNRRSVGSEMIADLKAGVTDVALMWGPIVAWNAKQQGVDVEIIPLKSTNERNGKMDFLMTMGVRKNERDWKRKINTLIQQNMTQITAILRDYGVPLLDIYPRRKRHLTKAPASK